LDNKGVMLEAVGTIAETFLAGGVEAAAGGEATSAIAKSRSITIQSSFSVVESNRATWRPLSHGQRTLEPDAAQYGTMHDDGSDNPHDLQPVAQRGTFGVELRCRGEVVEPRATAPWGGCGRELESRGGAALGEGEGRRRRDKGEGHHRGVDGEGQGIGGVVGMEAAMSSGRGTGGGRRTVQLRSRGIERGGDVKEKMADILCNSP
jgi:hypothetical protein